MILIEETKKNKKLIEKIKIKEKMARKNEQLALIARSLVKKNSFLIKAKIFNFQKRELFKLLDSEIVELTCRSPLFCDHLKGRN